MDKNVNHIPIITPEKSMYVAWPDTDNDKIYDDIRKNFNNR